MRKEVEKGFINTKKLAKYLEDAWYVSMKETNGFLCWDGLFTKPEVKKYKISICTTSMNRLDDIKRTLLKNIEDNSDYPYVEFVLLDYNSEDGLEDWVKSEMVEHINKGTLVYYRTEEPKFYDMSHSRNIAFKVSTGDIVNTVDADSLTNKGFATYINKLANEQSEKAIFAKSRQLLRGRLGFFKKDFIELLGGYDEDLRGYGHDDQDLLNRAWKLGFKMMRYGGAFTARVDNHVKHQDGNYKEEWWITEGRNRFLSYSNLILGKFKANERREWGKAKLIRNFEEEIKV